MVAPTNLEEYESLRRTGIPSQAEVTNWTPEVCIQPTRGVFCLFFLFFCLFFIKRFLSRDPEPLSSHKFCTTWAHFSRSSLKVGGHAGPGPSPPTFLLSITGRRPQAFQTPLPQSPCPPPPDCSHSPQMGQVLVVVPASCDLRLSWAPHRTRPGFG